MARMASQPAGYTAAPLSHQTHTLSRIIGSSSALHCSQELGKCKEVLGGALLHCMFSKTWEVLGGVCWGLGDTLKANLHVLKTM